MNDEPAADNDIARLQAHLGAPGSLRYVDQRELDAVALARSRWPLLSALQAERCAANAGPEAAA
ncbi:cellulose biosynthesis protein BcsR [Solimonas flava]|uniref:cellulose biosynthesis protein BcsR n=1 Tax=Solimonas flava TaxID=415849 RepID=UPI00042644FE|nr:cellulose biosynthesis protein BcsR [Solimonas flava]